MDIYEYVGDFPLIVAPVGTLYRLLDFETDDDGVARVRVEQLGTGDIFHINESDWEDDWAYLRTIEL